jgi:hypothetical protein
VYRVRKKIKRFILYLIIWLLLYGLIFVFVDIQFSSKNTDKIMVWVGGLLTFILVFIGVGIPFIKKTR